MSDQLRVLCVDDDIAVLDVLRLNIESEPDMKSVGSLSHGEDLMLELASIRPDIVILDARMLNQALIATIGEITEKFPKSGVIVYSGLVDHELAFKAFEAGASGCVQKGLPRDRLLRAIREVAAGRRGCVFCQ